jgi:hypothetical protein
MPPAALAATVYGRNAMVLIGFAPASAGYILTI